uniref:PCI domain-containing protein n=1 Tax=Euplotes crassus TaxID=5936 RepID=A0A7S3NSA5_EUPCR|mmetsp:Transcript_26229/g.26131  ORF Transcript_26229/g.26131 Transcript_26229/m.26131 type:complete len:140 (+) Transcript_26229:782-1201(+)
MLELGSTFINFDFDKYFKLLSQFQEEFRFDFYLSKNFFFMMQKCKKKVLVTYITPYKTVDLKEMADSIGMSIEDTERAVEELIETNEIKYKINKYNKSLSAKTEDYKLESFKKAVKVGDEFIKGMESMLLKYHLRKITK